MATKILVPELGESILEATVGRWLKKEGDRVGVGEALVELETEKVNLEVGAERAGVLAQILKKEGEDVRIGDVLGTIEDGAGPESEAPRPSEAMAAADSQRARPEPAATPVAGDAVKPRVEAAPAEPGDGSAAEPAGAAVAERATPVARRMAQEQGLDLAQIPGTGSGGRVTKEDVQAYLEQSRAAAPAPPPAKAAPPAPPGAPAPAGTLPLDRTDREERQRMSRRRRTIARRLVEAMQTTAMLTTFNEIDMSRVIEIRQRRKESFKERHGVGLGFMSFFVRASVGALKKFPRLNAEIQGDEVVLKHYYDIGIAIGAEEGLVVPVLRDADRMSFAEIEQAINTYVEKSRAGSLSLEDLRGGTFTLSNGGVYGSLLSTPILNPPQVGILGLHRIEERPVAVNGQVVIRPMMYVALSYDHRIVDGREAVQFLVRIKELIEDPETLLLEG